MPDSPQPAADRRPRHLFLGAVIMLTLLSLLPIWAVEFPPLQDYPQHLFLAHVNATFDNPAYHWSQFYQAQLRPGPYSLFYYLVVWLERVMAVTMAGRVYLSAYIGLLAVIAVVVAHQRRLANPPWGTLLLFPLAFHQIYFMGFTNFLLSVPLLGLAILDHQRLADGPGSARGLLRQAIMVLILFLCHPYTILVYIVLTAGSSMLPGADGRRQRAAMIPPLLTAAIFAVWYLTAFTPAQGRMPLLWWSVPETIRYYLLMFTGMRWSEGINWSSVATWLVAVALVLWGVMRGHRQGVRIPRRTALACALATAGFFALPFWAGQYSYFNLRLAPFSYLFAAILAGYGLWSARAGLLLALVAAILVCQTTLLHMAVSRETAEIKPLIATMEPNAAILPMTFTTTSAILDRHFFPEVHSHDHFYYHLQAGGASPSLFPSPMLPVRFRAGVDLPLATHGFSWQEQGSKYDYILTRGAPKEFVPFITRYAPQVSQSGEWLLFRNEHRQ